MKSNFCQFKGISGIDGGGGEKEAVRTSVYGMCRFQHAAKGCT